MRASQPGQQSLVWDGKDSAGANVIIGSEVSGTVDSVDMSKTPPVLTIGSASYTMDKITKVTRPGL